MSNLLNKSNHPVEVKKIQVRIWTLRDEIEAAIETRIKEEANTDGTEVFIDDIKEYYHNIVGGPAQSNESEDDDDDDDTKEDTSNLDSSGNPLDDDALAMMAAISGGDEESSDEEKADNEDKATDEDSESAETESEENKEEKVDEDSSEDDDDAAAAALAMLADQGLDSKEEDSPEDDDAAAAALAMLADQGIDSKEEGSPEDDAAAAALAMLADQGLGEEPKEEEVKREPFKRVRPSKDKTIDGFIMLSDIQMDQALVFSQKGFVHGQNIIIEFLVTNSFSISASVKVVTNISRNSKIISQTRPNYRVQGILLFQFPEERSQLRNFLKSIEPEIPVQPKKVKRTDDDDDDDDFDDLGF